MSGKVFGNGNRISRQEVERIIEILRNVGLHEQCEKIEVCGSYRRQRETCGDIDIVIVPKRTEDFLSWFNNVELEKQIGKIAYYLAVDNVQIDIFVATPQTWGIMVMNYTGPAQFNVFIAAMCAEMGHRYTKQKILDSSGNCISDYFDDRAVFEFLKLDYIAPQNRQTFF